MSEITNEQSESRESECDSIRSIEKTRLRSLVERRVDLAANIHADDFQLITPVGMSFSKEQYLGAIAAGALVYNAWSPKQIEVRLYGKVAVIRYQSSMEVTFGPHHIPRAEYWHTDLYEKRGEAWQVVWSQATEVRVVA